MENEDKIFSIQEEVVSKSEQILTKLKKLKNKAWLAKDEEAQQDLDWVITNLNEKDMYEPQLRDNENNLKSKNELDYLVRYSHLGEVKRRENDLITMNNNQLRSTLNSFKSMPVNGNIMSPSRRSTKKMSTLISPSLIGKVYAHLSYIAKLDFNIFDLNDLVDRQALFYMTYEMFSIKQYFDYIVDEDKMKNFVGEILNGYPRSNSYHNDLHAGDVFQTLFYILESGNGSGNGTVQEQLNLNDLDVFSVLISALCHDYKHTGHNNLYHVNSKSNLARRYNDISVLENFSIAETYKVMLKEENNIMSKLTPQEYRISRKRIIESIIATDMALHHKYLFSLKTKMEKFDVKKGKNIEKLIVSENVNKTFENQQTILNFCLHAADVSSTAKPFELCEKWKDSVYEEFFTQGDEEKLLGLPVSLLCDRTTTSKNRSQVSFISFIILPLFEVLANLFPECNAFVNNLSFNSKKYKMMVREEEEEEVKK